MWAPATGGIGGWAAAAPPFPLRAAAADEGAPAAGACADVDGIGDGGAAAAGPPPDAMAPAVPELAALRAAQSPLARSICRDPADALTARGLAAWEKAAAAATGPSECATGRRYVAAFEGVPVLDVCGGDAAAAHAGSPAGLPRCVIRGEGAAGGRDLVRDVSWSPRAPLLASALFSGACAVSAFEEGAAAAQAARHRSLRAARAATAGVPLPALIARLAVDAGDGDAGDDDDADEDDDEDDEFGSSGDEEET